MEFEYPEDKNFFVNLLAGGNSERFEKEFKDYFDFRHYAIKRWEFNKIKNKLLKELIAKYNGKCQLHIHPDCSKSDKLEPDHIIPLATNRLNKEIRHMTTALGKKVPSQSFGSNNIKNLTLACKRCNAFKKQKIIIPS